MAGADFCRSVVTPRGATSSVAERQTSRGKARDLRSTSPHLRAAVPGDIGFRELGLFAHDGPPRMRFLFVKPELCLQLPPDPVSRR